MPARVWILWLLFLVRGAFYCSLLPLWEGWDEYAHVAFIQHWITAGTLPRPTDGISRELDESMRLGPLPAELRWIGPPYLTHEQWWRLGEAERAQRRNALRTLPPAWAGQPALHKFDSYEAQQPPLYYWLLSIPARAAAGWPLEERVRLLRWLSVLLASLTLPFTWLAARETLPEKLRLIPVALLAVAPGFAIDVSRVANDALLIPAAAAFLWLLARRRASAATGVALGIAILAKASGLALFPAIVLLWFRKARRELAAAVVIGLAIGGWWYAGNLLAGRSMTGWILDKGLTATFQGIRQINWLSALDVEAKTFLWFGGWSFLTLKSWMYRVPEALALAALAGLALRRPARLAAPLVFMLAASVAFGWGIPAYFAAQGVPNLPGWYMWPFAPALGILFTAGLARGSSMMVIVLALLDVYGAGAVMAPYYAGLQLHNHASFALLPQALVRLEIAWPLFVAWLAATLAIPVLILANRRNVVT